MRKYLLGVLMVVFLLTAAGCANNPDSTETTTTPSRETTNDPSHVHKYTAREKIKPTCTEDGYTLMVCSCGDLLRTAFVGSTGHHYQPSQVVEATQTHGGYTVFQCRCGESYVGDKTGQLLPTEPPLPLVCEQHLRIFIHSATKLWYGATPDLSGCKEGHLYFYYRNYRNNDEISSVYPLVDEPVSCVSTGTFDNQVFFVKESEPGKVYSCEWPDLSVQKVIYENDSATINEVNSIPSFKGYIFVVEDHKRGLKIDLSTGQSEVLFEAYYLFAFDAELDQDGNVVQVWFRGQPTENHRNYTYFYYPDSGKFVEHDG